MKSFWITTGALVLIPASVGQVPPGVEVLGVSSRTVYDSPVTIQIRPQPNYLAAAWLNGKELPIGEPVPVQMPDYYELNLETTDPAGGKHSGLIQFIIRDPTRGNTEIGLPPWTPPPIIPSNPQVWTQAAPRLIYPSTWIVGYQLPIAVWMLDEQGHPIRACGVLSFSEDGEITIRRGVGSGFLTVAGAGPIQLKGRLGTREISINLVLEPEPVWEEAATPSGLVTLPAGSHILVTSDLTIPNQSRLEIEKGCVIALEPGVTIWVEGELIIKGAPTEPVVLMPKESEKPWGGIVLRSSGARALLESTILTGAGADQDWFDRYPEMGSSHRDEQPALYCGPGTEAIVRDSVFMHLHGQAAHGEDASVTFERTLVQRCTTTGQFNGGTVRVADSALIEFPIHDPVFIDGDNDAIYLTEGTHQIERTLIGWTKDDGIDSGSGGGGTVTVSDCWIESCFHEGLAWSGQARLTRTTHTVILNCGQGTECGWSSGSNSPQVYATDCYIAGNVVGARFGDNYDWTYNGYLEVTNSVLVFNYRDIWGMNWDDWTYRTNQMNIHSNFVTRPQPRHPDNFSWIDSPERPSLTRWIPHSAQAPGIGFANWDRQLVAGTSFPGPVLGLSEPVDHEVRVVLRLVTASEKKLYDVVVPAGAPWIALDVHKLMSDEPVWLQLVEAQGAVITGNRDLILLNPPEQSVLVPAGAVWAYLDGNRIPGPDWRLLNYQETGWKRGRAQLGFGDGDEQTVIDGGPDGDRYPTVYFRHTFTVSDPCTLSGLQLDLLCDDGAIVYINGVEVFRFNMPDGPVQHTTFTGTAVADEDAYVTITLSRDLLVPGDNILAVEVHQASPTSSDMSFDLKLTATCGPLWGWLHDGSRLVLFSRTGRLLLEQSASPFGPWSPVDANRSPYFITPTEQRRFFRILVQGP